MTMRPDKPFETDLRKQAWPARSAALLLLLMCAMLQHLALAATDSVPAQERLKSCDPKIALAAAEEIIKSPDSLKEPLHLFSAASTLFHQGRKDDGVFWFYAAQLRARYQLAFEKGDRGQLLSIMLATVGQPINNYAFQDTRKLDRTLERVLQWDRSTPNPFKDKPKSADTEKHVEGVYRGFADLRTKIAAERDELERQARAAAPQIQQTYASMRPPPCQKGQIDPAYAQQAMESERPIVVEFVKNHKDVIRAVGTVKGAYPGSYMIKQGEVMPSRYDVTVEGDKRAYAIVNVSRPAGKAEFTLVCVTDTSVGRREPSKDACKQ